LPKVDATSPALADQVASIGLVSSDLGPDVPVIQTVFSPLTVADYLLGRGRGEIVNELKSRRELVEPALNLIADALIDFSRASIQAGAAGIFFAISGHASRAAVPIDLYQSAVLPYDQKVLDAIGSNAWFNVLHLCQSEIYFELTDSLPTHAVSWSVHDEANPSLEEGISRSGRAAVGGIDQSATLLKGPREAIEQSVKVAAGANGGRGVIVAPGCSVPPEVPDDHLRVLADTVEG
jgi:uroporphyrinogen decarboxylase